MDGSIGVAPRPWCLTRRFVEADDLARSLKAAGVVYLPLHAGPLDARLTVIGRSGMILQRTTDRAHVVRGSIAEDAVTLVFALRQDAAPSVNGWTSDGTDGLLLGRGLEVHALCPGAIDWVALALAADAAAELAELAGLPDAAYRPGATLRLARDAIQPLRCAASRATDAVVALGDAAPSPALAEALTASLWETVMAAFAGADTAPVPRATRAAIRLVDAAEALLRAHPDRPCLTADLCDALAVSPRSLHKAFVAATGISPQAYLRRRRLTMVHMALKDGGGDAGLVKSVALAHGFWHLGHFARAYREQFGQTPSETLAAARAGRYRRAVLPRSGRRDGAHATVGMG